MSGNGVVPPKRSRFDIKPSGSATNQGGGDVPNGVNIQEIMAKANKELEERKRILQERVQAKLASMNAPTTSANRAPHPAPIPRPASTSDTNDSKSKIAMLSAQIQARLINSKIGVGITGDGTRPTPLILNSEGRTVDQSGKEVQLITRVPTLKANIRAQKKDQIIKIVSDKNDKQQEPLFVDHNLRVKGPARGKRSFNFHEKGTFQELGEKLRTKAKLEYLQKEIAEKAKTTGISTAARLSILSSIVPKKEKRIDEIPDVEWWDAYVIKDPSYEESLNNPSEPKDKFEGITHLIEHPLILKPPSEPTKIVALPVFLTKKEQKKLRRVNRRETWKEKQEKIRMGLEEPPEPKLKLSNMMRALGQQAVQDPTKIEAHVKEQMMRRQKAHEEANASRALTGEQKKAKKVNKIKEDTSLGVNVAVYRVLNLHNPAKKFKVEANMKQLLMTGVVVAYKNVNVVVVEGGPKQQKKFKKLMMSRIKWSEEEAESGEADKKTENKCFIVWEGMVKQRNFGEVKFKISPNESFARGIFKNHGVEHYWDLAYSMSILNTDV